MRVERVRILDAEANYETTLVSVYERIALETLFGPQTSAGEGGSAVVCRGVPGRDIAAW